MSSSTSLSNGGAAAPAVSQNSPLPLVRTVVAIELPITSRGRKSTRAVGSNGRSGILFSSISPTMLWSPWKLGDHPVTESPKTIDGRIIALRQLLASSSRSACRLDSK